MLEIWEKCVRLSSPLKRMVMYLRTLVPGTIKGRFVYRADIIIRMCRRFRYLRNEGVQQGSVYDQRELLVF